MEILSAINNSATDFSVIWDLGRRCTYSCSYCGPERSNKTSPNASYELLKNTLDGVIKYVEILDTILYKPRTPNISFTGGEPTVNPNFFDFVDYIEKINHKFHINVTTNGCYSLDKCKKLTNVLDSITLSYHPSATNAEKNLVKQNIYYMAEINYNFKVNLMFHVDYFDECVKLAEEFDNNGIKYIPRKIGDTNNKEDILLGYTHVYSDSQLAYFKDYWKSKREKVSDGAAFGRPCCAGKCMDLKFNDWTKGKFVPTNNYKGWQCMVNFSFLYINSELDEVYHHQTCKVNLNSEVGPIGKASEFDTINTNLHNMITTKSLPIITCPKTWCGCGLCAPKAKDETVFTEIYKSHVIC